MYELCYHEQENMPRSTGYSKKRKSSSTAIVSRLRKLETKQRADDKMSERKVFYYSSFGTGSSTWASNNGFALRTQQGVAAEGNTAPGLNRIGNSVNMRSCTIDFSIKLPVGGLAAALNEPSTSTMYRLIIADNLTDDTALTATDLLESPTFSITSPYKNKIGSGKRYRIYADYKFPLNYQQPYKNFRFKMALPKSGRVVHFNGNSSSQPSDFNLSMIWVATGVNVTSPDAPLMEYYVKTRFEDA